MLDFVLTALATHRVTRLVIEDEITADIREKIFEKDIGKLSYFITCPWCVSIWAAAGLTAVDLVSPKAGKVLKTVLAASSVTGIVQTSVV